MAVKRTEDSPIEFGSESGAFQTLHSRGNSSWLTSLAEDSLKGVVVFWETFIHKTIAHILWADVSKENTES